MSNPVPTPEPRVNRYDVPSGSVTSIPARELAPGMTRVRVEGIEGECWIHGTFINNTPYQYAPFDEETRDILRSIKKSLDEVNFQSLEEWEDGFRRERDAEREIAIWEFIARKYLDLTAGKDADQAEKLDIFRLLLSCANNPKEQALAVAGVVNLSKPEAESVLTKFYEVET